MDKEAKELLKYEYARMREHKARIKEADDDVSALKMDVMNGKSWTINELKQTNLLKFYEHPA